MHDVSDIVTSRERTECSQLVSAASKYLENDVQELVGDSADVMELVAAAFSQFLELYPDMELSLLRLHYFSMPQMVLPSSPKILLLGCHSW